MDHLSLKERLDANRKFKENNKRKYILANDFLETSTILMDAFFRYKALGPAEQLIIQDVLDLSWQSISSAILNKPQVSLALLRLALEKYRDLICIIEKPELSEMYMKGRKQAPKGEWRKTFRFNDNNKAAINLYNIASDYGVHSTMPFSDDLSLVKEIDGVNFNLLTNKRQTKEVFILSLMGLSLFLWDLSKALKTRVSSEIKAGVEGLEEVDFILFSAYQQLTLLQPKLDKLIKVRR